MEDESKLQELKESYLEIQKQYSLPVFEEINKDFQIEKLADTETDILVREVRKFMAEKFSNYLRFIETLLHPTNVPMFVFAIVKTLKSDDKEKLSEIYKKLAQMEVQLVELDVNFSEDKEVEFIKDNFKIWQEIKIITS